MKILDDLISILDFNTPVEDIRQGVFHTGVLTRYCGLAETLPRDALKQEGPLVKEPGFLLDKTPGDLVQMAYSESILEASIGMAAINSLLDRQMGQMVSDKDNMLNIHFKRPIIRCFQALYPPFCPRNEQYREQQVLVVDKNLQLQYFSAL